MFRCEQRSREKQVKASSQARGGVQDTGHKSAVLSSFNYSRSMTMITTFFNTRSRSSSKSSDPFFETNSQDLNLWYNQLII